MRAPGAGRHGNARPCSTPTRPRRRAPSRAEGFEWLHVVDLNGAFAGRSVNGAAVEAILAAVDDPGPARRRHPRHGGDRRLAREGRRPRHPRHRRGARPGPRPRRRRSAYPGRVAVGIDARGGKVAVEGWAEATEIDAIDLARRFEDAGVAAIIYTDIDRDGVLKGLNIAATLTLARAVSIPVIASGGLASLADIERLLEPDCAILEGAISGRALYDGRLDAAEALALIRAAREAA